MNPSFSTPPVCLRSRTRRARREVFRAAALLGLGVSLAFTPGIARARDILRLGGGGAAPQGKGVAGASNAAGSAAAAQAGVNAKSLLARTTQAVQGAQALQKAAQAAALSRPNSVPNGLAVGGLQIAPGVPKNLAKPVAGESSGLWLGAKLPVQTSLANGTTEVTIQQTSSQALLNWQTFNVGNKTDVYFNQKGGTKKDGGNDWIAFNKINDPSGAPSQILGSLHGEGSVYLINANGIVFGGTSQINLHGFVASALPINDNLIDRGLLNDPDQQFLFSALPITRLSSGAMPAFTPLFSDNAFAVSGANVTHEIPFTLAGGTSPTVTFADAASGAKTTLQAGQDFTIATGANQHSILTFTAAGANKIGANAVTVSYYRAPGDVVVQAGARLSAPTSASHAGGRVALIGANVSNAGTISTPDGQTILASGAQVGLFAHPSSDATLRGLDVVIGTVSAGEGTSINSGLIQVPRGDAWLAGQTVQQMGTIASSTSVSLNGRIDLQANYNTVRTLVSGKPQLFATSAGQITLGAGSVSSILPELDSADTVTGTSLALRSAVSIEGHSVLFGAQSTLFAPGGQVTVDAGSWRQSSPGVTAFTHDSGSDLPGSRRAGKCGRLRGCDRFRGGKHHRRGAARAGAGEFAAAARGSSARADDRGGQPRRRRLRGPAVGRHAPRGCVRLRRPGRAQCGRADHRWRAGEPHRRRLRGDAERLARGCLRRLHRLCGRAGENHAADDRRAAREYRERHAGRAVRWRVHRYLCRLASKVRHHGNLQHARCCSMPSILSRVISRAAMAAP